MRITQEQASALNLVEPTRQRLSLALRRAFPDIECGITWGITGVVISAGEDEPMFEIVYAEACTSTDKLIELILCRRTQAIHARRAFQAKDQTDLGASDDRPLGHDSGVYRQGE
jgi:hypothetical protein